MGIKGLNTLLKNKTQNAIVETTLSEFKNCNIAIDLSIYAYRFLYNNGNIYYKFLQQVSILLQNKITPIYVFDGKPPEQKKEVLDNRKNIRNKKIETKEKIIQDLKNPNLSDIEFFELQEKKNKIEKSLIYITPEIINNLKIMFDLLGINYIQANGEADTVCCQLFKDGITDGSMSEDFDLLPRGSGILIKNFNLLNNNITKYNLDSVLNDLKLTEQEFIDLSILCGCDYTSRITGIGPVNALKLIKKYKNIETIINEYCKNKKNIFISEDFDYIKARNMMNVPENEFSDFCVKRNLSKNTIKYVSEWLYKKTSINKKILNNHLKYITFLPVNKSKTIEQYFS